MVVKELINIIENFAPKQYQESYDNSGLIVGDPKMQISGVLVCLDSTENVLEEAIEKECNVVVAHHPIVFSGIKSFTGKNYIERVIIKAIKNEIAIYACHTNLDNVKNGVNAKIAEKLGLKNCKLLSPKKELLKKLITFCPTENTDAIRTALSNAGAGCIGNYSECSFSSEGKGTFKAAENTNPHVGEIGKLHTENETRIEMVFPSYLESKVVSALVKNHPYEEVAYDIISLDNSYNKVGSGMVGELENEVEPNQFLQSLKTSLKTDIVRHTKTLNKPIKLVAVCGGSGSFLLGNAIAANADVFITGDYKYHQFFDADNKIIIADVGHYESEQFTKELLSEVITKKSTTFATHISEVNTNPIHYI